MTDACYLCKFWRINNDQLGEPLNDRLDSMGICYVEPAPVDRDGGDPPCRYFATAAEQDANNALVVAAMETALKIEEIEDPDAPTG